MYTKQQLQAYRNPNMLQAQQGAMPRGQNQLVPYRRPVATSNLRNKIRKAIRKPRKPTQPSSEKKMGSSHLSKCAQDYLCALEDPFNCIEDCCVPLLPSTPSRKIKVFSKGTLTVGVNGFGFIYYVPCADNTTNYASGC
jgi:hypothetical protein